MARSTKSKGPNAAARKAAARKAGKCQLCGTKVGPNLAKSVIVDPPGVGDVKVVKAREGKSYWCKDCAGKKKASYERAIANKEENPKKKSTAKKAPAKKSTAKKSTPKKKSTGTRKKSTGKSTGTRKSTRSKAEPF